MQKNNCPKCGTDNSAIAKYCSGCGFQLPKQEAETVKEVEVKKPSYNGALKKKIVPIVAGILAFGLTFYAVQFFFSKPESFDKVMMQVASEINQSCPIMIDRDTRLDNTLAMPSNVFKYNYTLVNLEKSDIDIDGLRDYLEPIILNTIKTNPEMEVFRDHKTTLSYNYRDKNGVFILKLDITSEQYD